MSIELRAAIILLIIGGVTALTIAYDEIENRRRPRTKGFDCMFCGDQKTVRLRDSNERVPCPYCEGW